MSLSEGMRKRAMAGVFRAFSESMEHRIGTKGTSYDDQEPLRVWQDTREAPHARGKAQRAT